MGSNGDLGLPFSIELYILIYVGDSHLQQGNTGQRINLNQFK